MPHTKFRVVLLSLIIFVQVLSAGEDSAERENLMAALKQEGIVFAERTVELDTGDTGTTIWALIPSTEKEDTVTEPAEDSAMSALIEGYTDLAGEISAGLATSFDIPAEFPADSFVLIIPLSGQLYENGLSWGAETALYFIREVSNKKYRKKNLIIAFLDYEGAGGGEDLNALQDIYAALDNPENSILIFLDFPVPPKELFIYHGSRLHIAPLGILEPLTRLLEDRKIPYSFGDRFNELYKFALIGGTPVTEFTQSRDIPSLFISSTRVPAVTGGQNQDPRDFLFPNYLGELLADYSGKAVVEIGNLDTHYSFYHFNERTWFVSEILSVTTLLVIQGIVVIAFLFFFLTRRLKMLILLKIGIANSWVSLLYALALFLSILAGGALLFAFAALFRISLSTLPFGRLYPVLGLTALTGILLFFALPARPLTLFRIKRRGGFYGFTAISFSVLLFLLGSILDITVAPLFAWMLICVLLAMIWPHAIPAFFFSLVFLVRPVITVMDTLGDEELFRLFSANFILSALTVTLFALPFLLSLMRAIVFAIPYRIRKKPVFLFVNLGLFVICVVFLAVLIKGI
jgi:hypothetical protein